MTMLLVIVGLIGLLLVSAVVGLVMQRLRPPCRGKHTTALHHVLFKNEED